MAGFTVQCFLTALNITIIVFDFSQTPYFQIGLIALSHVAMDFNNDIKSV